MITATLTGNIGNNMHCYSICRVVAEKLGYDWGIDSKPMYDYFNGCNQMYFMDVDFGNDVELIGKNQQGLGLYKGIDLFYMDKHKHHSYKNDNCLINMYDKDVFNINDNTSIHMLSQSEDYYIDRKVDIINWFLIKDEYIKQYESLLVSYNINLDNTCIINFRGGEYKSVPGLILNKDYWKNSMDHIRSLDENIRFLIITDDVKCASLYIPGVEILHIDIGFDFYIVNKAKYVILSNSSFGWWATWLNTSYKKVIAPKYWSRHNISNGYWSLGDSYTRGFHYMDRDGVLSDYDLCKKEALDFYKNNNLI